MKSEIEVNTNSTKEIFLFYLLDVSGSMKENNVSYINSSMRTVMETLKEKTNRNIKIGILSFSNGANWETPHVLDDVFSYKWKDLKAGGLTDMGEAFQKLNAKITTDNIGVESEPIIFLITDGEATDNYMEGLRELRNNELFNKSIKVGIGFDDTNMKILNRFTENFKNILYLKDKSLLAKVLTELSNICCAKDSNREENIVKILSLYTNNNEG